MIWTVSCHKIMVYSFYKLQRFSSCKNHSSLRFKTVPDTKKTTSHHLIRIDTGTFEGIRLLTEVS